MSLVLFGLRIASGQQHCDRRRPWRRRRRRFGTTRQQIRVAAPPDEPRPRRSSPFGRRRAPATARRVQTQATATRAIKLANTRRHSNAEGVDENNDNSSNGSQQTIEHNVHSEVKPSKARRRRRRLEVCAGSRERRRRLVARLAPRIAYLGALWLLALASPATTLTTGAEVEAPPISEQRQETVGASRNRIPFESVQRSGGYEAYDFNDVNLPGELNQEARGAPPPPPRGRVATESADGDQDEDENLAEQNSTRQPASVMMHDDEAAAAVAAAAAAANDSCYEYANIVKGRPSVKASIAFICAYASIFLFGLAGNLLTIYVFIVKGCKRCSAQDVLICNLAISDVMLCVFAIPITPKYLVWDHYWKMGQFLCKVVSFTQSVSVYMSTYSLIVIGFIRYRLIVHPVGGAMSTLLASALCVGTALVAIILTMPYVNKIRLSPDHCEVKFCDESWQGNERFYFSLFTCVFQLSIPLLAVIFFYFNIYRRVDYRKTIMATSGRGLVGAASNQNSHHNQQQQQQQQCHSQTGPSSANSHGVNKGDQTNKTTTTTTTCNVLEIKEIRLREKQRKMRRMNKRLLWVVCIFAFSWFPLNLYNLLSDYYDELGTWDYITYVFLITHLIACSSVVWNPFLYAWMSDSFMSDLERAMPGWLRCGRLKKRLHEPSVISEAGGGGGSGGPRAAHLGGGGAGGRCGSPTSIVMVSTNGNNQQQPNSTGVAMYNGRGFEMQLMGADQKRVLGVACAITNSNSNSTASSEDVARDRHDDGGERRARPTGRTTSGVADSRGNQNQNHNNSNSKRLCTNELASGSSQEEELSDDFEQDHDESCERDDEDENRSGGQCQKCQEETKELNSSKTQFVIEICQ